MPTVGLSLVNHDNNQHGPDENLRIQNLWEGIEIMATIMTMPVLEKDTIASGASPHTMTRWLTNWT